VSIVTTTWNEKDNVEVLVPLIRAALQLTPHEIIVVDDDSPDGTMRVAERLADIAVSKPREGQTKGLLYGMRLARNPVIVTIDADLENDPALIPELVRQAMRFDIVVASRTRLPRWSEKLAAKTLGRLLRVTDSFSNYRAYRKEAVSKFDLEGGETFGAEFLVIARKNHLRIGEIKYEPPPRRTNPRIGGTFNANARILWALIKSLAICLT
jgi:dolichol-phosphate mannosyltransferase